MLIKKQLFLARKYISKIRKSKCLINYLVNAKRWIKNYMLCVDLLLLTKLDFWNWVSSKDSLLHLIKIS